MSTQYMYRINYSRFEEDLCKLEARSLFNGMDVKDKVLVSDNGIEPSTSPFLKERLEIIHTANSFDELLRLLEVQKITKEDFKVEVMNIKNMGYTESKRRTLCKEIGLRIEGEPSFSNPAITYGICYYEDKWFFGVLTKNNNQWKRHNEKPCTYSSSLGINTAKALVNIGSKGDLNKTIVDPCCGVGTVLLEGLFAGYDIHGYEINEKVAENARENLSFYDYPDIVITCDIGEIKKNYDVSIIDIPYGNFSSTSNENQQYIIKHAIRISKRVILISSKDMSECIEKEGYKIIDTCKIGKGKKGNCFFRYVWVCE